MPVLPVKAQPSVTEQPVASPKTAEISIINELPSGFRSYDVKHLEVRALTLGEMKYLLSSGLTRHHLVDLYKNVILNYDVNKLTWADLTFIVAHIAIFTTPSVFWTFPTQCTSCSKRMQIKLGKDKFLQFEDMSSLQDYPLYVTINGEELEFGFLTVERYLDLTEKASDMEKHLEALYILASMVTNKPLEEAFKIIEGITSLEDAELLIKVSDLLYHDTLPIEWVCEHCGHVDKYKVDAEVSTVSPFRDPNKPIESRIKFGNRPNSPVVLGMPGNVSNDRSAKSNRSVGRDVGVDFDEF